VSEQTKQAIDDAIQAHVEDEKGGGDLVIGWVLTAALALHDDDGANGYWYLNSGHPIHHTLGLLEMARMKYARDMRGDE
jgi:hypothetical protein